MIQTYTVVKTDALPDQVARFGVMMTTFSPSSERRTQMVCLCYFQSYAEGIAKALNEHMGGEALELTVYEREQDK